MSTTAAVVIAVIVVLVVVGVVAALMRGRRRSALQQRFGPEYERTVSHSSGRREAERDLRERERHHAELPLRELDPQQRQRYANEWEQTQAHFVDQPETATREADQLVTQVMSERGYPVEDFDRRISDLSVEHASTLEHYRDAHEINLANERGQATTEQLRQALVHYRALFAELLGDSSGGRQVPRHG
jgi:plasmid stabilization system protein ParE